MTSKKEAPPEQGGGKNNSKRIFRIVSVACILIAVGALVYIGFFLREYFVSESSRRRAGNAYDRIVFSEASTPPAPTPWPSNEPPPMPTPLPSYMPEIDQDAVLAMMREFERSQLLRAEEEGRSRFHEMLEINPDYLGMFLLEGLNMKYPYVQGADNEIYLDVSFEGKRSLHGAIFLSAYNDRLLMDNNNVMFGHYTETGTMFTPLRKYNDIKTWEKAPVVELDSLHGKTTWLVFSAYVSDPDYGYIDTSISGEAFADLLEEFHMRSLFHTNIEVTEEDRVLTLSTCAYEFNDARFVVHARKLRDGEDLEELLAERTIEKNPSPKPYDVPMYINFSEVPANRTAAMLHTTTARTYYFQGAEDGGMEYYLSTGSNVQGPYSGYDGPMTQDSTLSAVYSASARRSWVAFDGYKGAQGIFLLTSRVAAGPYALSRRTAVTPAGVDARWPLLALDDSDNLWLVYTVTETAKGNPDPDVPNPPDVTLEHVYRMSLKDGNPGTPELILTRTGGRDIRPVGLYWMHGQQLLIWQEVSSQKLFSQWLGVKMQPYELRTPGNHDRVVFYGPITNGSVRLLTVKNGKLTAGARVDIGNIPVPATPQPVATPEPEAPAPDVPAGEGENPTVAPETEAEPAVPEPAALDDGGAS